MLPRLDAPRLGINIDHVATLRNARGGTHPCPVDAARLAIASGADGITAHLREDRRHINDDDMTRLQALCLELGKPLNFEMAATEDMLEIALATKPHAVCLVPESRNERTTEGGLNASGLHNQITHIARALAENGSRVSLFIEAVPHQIEASHKCGAQVVEFHTGAYAHALDAGDADKAEALLQAMRAGAKQADALGLEVHFGHGLTFGNVSPIAAISEGKELNIGHFIIGEAVFMGLKPAIAEMRRLIAEARNIDI
ncbi:MAG: pyridoxine 5'-phosphate synthase [Robiginitomaculum sp.]|nr:pyridoxine 5'-phosphate synthase [Robiginitomaculum sp.]